MKRTTLVVACMAAATAIPGAANGVLINQSPVQVAGAVREIAAGGDGSVWALSTTSTSTAPSGVKNYSIHKWNESRRDWDNIAGEAYKIAVGPDGTPWIITAQGGIWRRSGSTGFQQLPGGASDIAIGGNGTVYVTGGVPATGYFNNQIYQLSGTNWVSDPGQGMMVAVEPLGTPWTVNAAGVVWRKNGDSRVGWAAVPGDVKMTHIAVGAGGHVWASGADDLGSGNHSTYQWDGQQWIKTTAQTVRVAVQPDGRPWFVTSQGTVWRGEPQQVPMELFGKVTPPPPAPPAPSLDGSEDICWKVTTTRGAGTVPKYCPQGTIEDPTGYLCYKQCQAGYNGVGPVCWDFPKSYGRGGGSIKDGCGVGNEYDAGLCYPVCPPKSSGVGPVCWGTCGGKYPTDCGAACATSDIQCAGSIVNMITSVADSALSIFGMVVSGGATAAATTAFRTAAKSAAAAGTKAATKEGLKAFILQQAKDIGKELTIGEAESLAVSGVENFFQHAAGGEPSFDPASLDPTGIGNVVQAFKKPMCEAQLISTVTPADPMTTINTTVFAIDQNNNLLANSGWAWTKVPGGANTSYVTVAHDGTIWRLDTAGKAWAWSGSAWTPYGHTKSFREIATAGGFKVWALGTDGAFYKFDGKQFMKVESKFTAFVASNGTQVAATMEHVSVSLSGTVYLSGRSQTGTTVVLRYEPTIDKFSTMFFGQTTSTAISAAKDLMMVTAEGTMASLSGTNILAGIGHSPTGLKAVAAGGSGEIWFLNQSGQPGRVVKWVPGSGNLAASVEVALFDTNSFKQIAIR